MQNTKLDKLADLLLDTGKRSNLINFKDTKFSTAEVVFPSSDVLFNKIEDSISVEIFDPQIIDDDEECQQDIFQYMDKEKSNKKENFLSKYSSRIKGKNQILLYSQSGNPITVIRNINKKSRQFIEETGVNVAYMVFGFIHWTESESSNYIFHAPVLLVPIYLEQESAIDPYSIIFAEEDAIVNPTFSYKIETEYGIKLPPYSDEGLTNYLDKIRKIVSKMQWKVTSECKIGIFSFLKINMYRDLKDNAESILSNINILRLLGESINAKEICECDNNDQIEISNPLIELHNVIDADSSQIEAIEMAKSGRSFVLQGPPGSGKSQTITNIIAELLSDGKKVLFVSEKLAALNVVYEKLKQAGLSEFCLQLHSHKANKKEIITDICHTLKSSKSVVSSRAYEEIEIKEKAQKQLDLYAFELHKHRPIIEKSLYQLYESYSAFQSMPSVEWIIPQIFQKGEKYLKETVYLLEQYVDNIPYIGYDYKKNPWYGYINQDKSYKEKYNVKNALFSSVHFLQELIPLQQEISERYGIRCSSVEDAVLWNDFFDFSSSSKVITSSLLNIEHFNEVSLILPELKKRSLEIISLKSELSKDFNDEIFEINGELFHNKLTNSFNGIFSRIFNSDYRQIISKLRSCYNNKKISYAEAVCATEKLEVYQKKCFEYSQLEETIKSFLGCAYNGVQTDWEYLTLQLETLDKILKSNILFGDLKEYQDLSSENIAFKNYSISFKKIFDTNGDRSLNYIIKCFSNDVYIKHSDSCCSILTWLNECLNAIDKLDNWCNFRTLISELDDKQVVPYIDFVINNNVEPKYIVGTFQKNFYHQWIELIFSETPFLYSFSRVSQDKAIEIFKDKDIEQFEINKAKIRSALSSKRPSVDIIAPGSSLSTLLREGEKKRKQKSIRSLLSETGDVVQIIKPCFLMSPLSVSTFLSPDSVKFDTVIFDEASQIFPQDAIGAIYRGKQLIVVGDSKQMPPSNFFNTSIDSSDNDDEENEDITDFESILDLCSTFMEQIRLCWHYRSRYEELITFSNKNFYDGELITFPSSNKESNGTGVDYFYVNGVYDRKTHTNIKEAEFIVDLIYKNIEKFPDRSLGVVAFSVSQQELIDKLLLKRRQESPEQEFYFNSNDKDSFFIKNLETVQGDERDTIIFSIAYGFDSQGRLLHNFGPLNRSGGERRLNVAVTRSKYNVQLVASIHYSDIDLKRTSSEGARLLREYLDFAENGNIALDRSVNTNTFDQFDSDFEMEVCNFLRSNGFSVDTQIGCSGFKIDLGLKLPMSSNYVLAIECDGATYHSSKNARDRDRLRQEILESMGWKFYRIWSTEWFRNKSIEQWRLLKAANDAINTQEKNKISTHNKPKETFEEVKGNEQLEFQPYKAVDFFKIGRKYGYYELKEMVKEILETEAPLSEELFLRRMLWYFGREKLTSAVKRLYRDEMTGYKKYGIIIKNGFLYLENGNDIKFRKCGDIKREINQIAPEELSDGMLEIIKKNVTVDKNSLYKLIASLCGFNRISKLAKEEMDVAFELIKDSVIIDGEQISIK